MLKNKGETINMPHKFLILLHGRLLICGITELSVAFETEGIYYGSRWQAPGEQTEVNGQLAISQARWLPSNTS